MLVSAKQGIGTEDVLRAIVKEIPPAGGDPAKPMSALIFDSTFSIYRGVILLIRVVDGTMKKGARIRFFSTGLDVIVEDVGYLMPKQVQCEELSAGDVGYVICGIKDIHQVRVGDTLMESARPLKSALPGYKEAKPVVFAGVFPINPTDYTALKAALDKLNLEDSSFNYFAGNLAGPGLRLPPGLSRPSAHGHRQGAPRARVQSRPDRDRAQRHLPRADHGRRLDRRSTTLPSFPSTARSRPSRSPTSC